MTTPVEKKEAPKPKVKITKRALVQLTVTGFQGEFPRPVNLSNALQQRAATLGYLNVGEVTVDAKSTDVIKFVNIAATDVEPVRLIGILDDVLKTLIPSGYDIALADVTGPVTTELKLKRMTKKQFKLAKQAIAAATAIKSAPQAKTAVKPAAKVDITKKALTFIGKRTGAYKKISRKYAVRQLEPGVAPDPTKMQNREYNASGTDGVAPEVEARMVASFLYAAYGLEAESVGAKLVVGADASLAGSEVDSLVAAITMIKVPGAKTVENLKAITNWQDAHSGVYVDTTMEDGWYVVGPSDRIKDVPTLA